jgi:7-cyano-7-deazaguanine reductase
MGAPVLGPLGHATGYPDRYDPSLLFPVSRVPQRREIGVGDALPFKGADAWTAYEHTWLDARGKPRIAMLSLAVPVESPFIVESKSMKLYLGSFAQTSFDDEAQVQAAIARDVSAATGAAVEVAFLRDARIAPMDGVSIDGEDVAIDRYDVDPSLLRAGGEMLSETLRSDLFRSVCPVTGQPDYASVAIAYRGPGIDRGALLRYLVSYRLHAGFHEHCAERIFVDLAKRCACESLTVHARFTRRGGIDINPFRTNAGEPVPASVRTERQ